ncbi:dual-specificity protein phosphatase [Novymonas esmeraldas]|uniref:protein-tyrosine-phosphatase n=1 Tax=Novymonas esmeraldas TaxID=1808958 RepID=A0AAW0F6B1_9TRYP
MLGTGGGSGDDGVNVPEAASSHAAPEVVPESFAGVGAAPSRASPPPPLLNGGGDAPAEASSPPHKRKDKVKREKRSSRPLNALHMLAGAMGSSGGAGCAPAASDAAVVDLRALDTSPCRSRESRTPRRCGGGRESRSCAEDVPATQILDFLFLGSVRDAQDGDFLAKHQIRYIINVSQEEYWSVDAKVQIFTFKVDDSATADIASLFKPTRDLINSIRARYYGLVRRSSSTRPAVLVHCQRGRSRSATIVLAYLVYTNGWSVAEAMRYVGSRRPCAEPNIGFMEELRKLQEGLAPEERTRRYSELCWFMRNLDQDTTQSQVRELFEARVGMVRHVVMHVLGADSGGGKRTHVDAAAPGDADDTSAPFSFEAALSSTPPSPAAATTEAELARLSHGGRTMLCFVFFACREDVLQGIKSGQIKQLLRLLRPAVGKQIKCATGPKLKRVMTEHQSMSSSFVQDIAALGGDQAATPGETEPPVADRDDFTNHDTTATTVDHAEAAT